MAELFIRALLGHLVGDYLLQSTWMALNKSRRDLVGWASCTLHVCLYTAVVCLLLGTHRLLVVVLIFVPHWLIDHYKFGELWSTLIGGRTIKKILKMPTGVERDFAVAFYAPVYIIVDNTWHLLCLWFTLSLWVWHQFWYFKF